ncbi:hypothetical protein H0H93_016686, partial [Arthromyces matolae]
WITERYYIIQRLYRPLQLSVCSITAVTLGREITPFASSIKQTLSLKSTMERFTPFHKILPIPRRPHEGRSSLSPGVIVGITVGCSLVVIVVLLTGFFCYVTKLKRKWVYEQSQHAVQSQFTYENGSYYASPLLGESTLASPYQLSSPGNSDPIATEIKPLRKQSEHTFQTQVAPIIRTPT